MSNVIAEAGPSRGRASGTSLHRQLFMVLRDEIQRGVYATSGALPKEESLGARFGVSRITVRRALADLAALGLVQRRHGLGTFVDPSQTMGPIGPSLGFVDSLRKTALETEVTVLEVAKAEPPPDIAALLRVGQGEQAVHALRMRSIDGIPVMLVDAWVPADIGKRVSPAALRKHALYEILLAQGVEFGRVVQEITAQVADPLRARWLDTDVGGPLLKLVRLLHDPSDRPVQHLTVYMCPERSRIMMEFLGESMNTLSAGQLVHQVSAPVAAHAPRRRGRSA